ncbi:MAG: hypothetical protein ACYDDA_00405 [Acidiferrobacteraceae bacterium]
MTVLFKLTRDLVNEVRRDLARPHPFAAERVGFISCRVGRLSPSGVIVLAHNYYPVADDDYMDDPTVAAMMGPGAIRHALEHAYNTGSSMFHVHQHEHRGPPAFSRIDTREARKFVPDFWHVQPKMPHGAIVLSLNAATGLCWLPTTREVVKIAKITMVGAPLAYFGGTGA